MNLQPFEFPASLPASQPDGSAPTTTAVADRANAGAIAFLASIVESSEDSIIGTNLKGTILSWNRSAEELFGYSREEAIGRHITILFPPEQLPNHMNVLERIKHQERLERFESVRMRRDGTPVEVSVILSPIRNSEGVLQGASAIYRDISKQKEARAELVMARQAAEAASHAKSEFLANMSHEIRTPMNVLLGMSGLLLETTLTEEQEDYARTIRRGAESLLAVINDILDFSKIEAGKIEIDATDFSIEEVVGEVTDLMSEQVSRKGLELTAELDPDIPTMVHADPVRVRQVLVNLVGNAVKFTQTGEIDVSVRCSKIEGARVLRFAVRDTGIGIPPEVQSRIFQAFTQADGSTTRKFGGTGLGLSISRKLAELMGGQIGLESEAGKGSTFWFTIPLIAGSTESTSPQPLTGLANLKVLAVDDNETNRRIVKDQLHSLNIQCELAENAMEAIVRTRDAAALGRPFDLVILDYGMPGMNGVDLARIIRSDSNLTATRLLLMTSYSEKKCRDTALEAGIDVVLNKPVRMSDLVRSLVRATGRTTPVVKTARSPDQTATVKCGRLLLAEDNPDNRKLAIRFLAKQGYECDVATNGEEAVKALAERSYPLVLMDCQMPVMDGFTATAAIRRMEEGGRRTPIIAVTAHAIDGDREKCLAAGMDDYISKPLTAKDLLAVVQRWVPDQSPSPACETPGSVDSDQRSADSDDRQPLLVHVSRDLEDLVPDYLSHTRENIIAIAKALAGNDLDAIRVIGHGLKGSGGGYGFPLITELGGQIERSAHESDAMQIQELMLALEAYVDRVEVVFD